MNKVESQPRGQKNVETGERRNGEGGKKQWEKGEMEREGKPETETITYFGVVGRRNSWGYIDHVPRR